MAMKQNDWIVATLNNPTFDAGDFQHILDMNLDNTQLLAREDYLKSRYIRENPNFLTEGLFDEGKFDSFYSQLVLKFGEFSTENIIDNYEYSMWDITRPRDGKVKEETVLFAEIPNPDHIRLGIEGFNEVTESDLSRRELAQQSKIRDSATGEYLDKSVNDISFTESPLEYFKSLFSEPLVYATYSEDGTHIDPLTKQEVEHKKGDWKLNDEGEYYTETLNGQSVVGKEVVSAGDYITSEDSSVNDYDFFDSDGLDKSVTGTIAKNLVTVAPLIFLGPVGTTIYGGLFVAREMAKTLPMLYGMYESFTGLEKLDNKLLNTISAYGSKFTTSTSDYAKQNIFSAENFVNLAGEVALQWGLLKAIADAFTRLTTGTNKSLTSAYNKAAKEYMEKSTDALINGMTSKLSGAKLVEYAGGASQKEFANLIKTGKWVETPFGKAAKEKFVTAAELAMESRMKAGQDLSLVYMSLISNTDVYNSVLEKGGTPLEAAAIALGSTIGMFSVDKYLGLGEMFFLNSAIRNSYRTAWRKEGSDIIDTIKRETGIQAVQPTKKELTNIISKSINKARNFVNDYHSKIKDNTLGFVGKSVGEGLEEVSEELVSDISKSLGELAGKLGYASQTDYGAFENPFERYMMSFLGGSLGGGLFYGVDAYLRRNDPIVKEGLDELIYLIRNHKKKDLMKELDKLHNQGKLGSTTLSYLTEKGADNKSYFITADENHISQNDYVYLKLLEVYNHLDTIINNNRVGLSEDELFLNMILSDSRYNAMKDFLLSKSYSTRYLEEFHNISKQLVDVDLEIESLTKNPQDSNSVSDSAKRTDPQYQEKLNELLTKKKDLQDKRDLFLSGELSLHYIKKMLFAIDPHLSGLFMSINKNLFTRESLGRSYDEISKAERDEIDRRYEEYKRNEKPNLDKAFAIYEKLEKDLMPLIEEMSTYDALKELDRFLEMMKKHPSIQALKWNSQLPNESEEAYKNRDTQLENETEEAFNARKLKRKLDIEAYNNEHYAEFVSDFAKMGLDNSSFRTMHLALGYRRKDVEDGILDQIKVTTKAKDPKNPDKEITKVDVELTNLIKNLLASKKPLGLIFLDLRLELKAKHTATVDKKYKDVRDLDIGWESLKEGFLDGAYSDLETLNIALTVELLKEVKTFYDNQTEVPEGGFTDFDDYLYSFFNENTVKRFHELLNFEGELAAARSLRESERDSVVNELLNTGQLDPANLSEQDLQVIEELTNSRMLDVNKELTASLSSLYPELEIEEGAVLSLDLIETINNLLQQQVIEVNELSIRKEIDDNVELDIISLTPNISDVYKKLTDSPLIKVFDSLELNLYRQNPALQLFSKISAKIGNVDVNVEEFLESLHKQYQEIENFLDFKLTDEQKKTLETLRTNLLTASALIYAASKNTSYNSPIGLNKSVNEFIQNHSDIFKSDLMLPEMTEELGQFLLMELSVYENEINAWLQRAESNRVNKISLFVEAEKALNTSLKEFYDTNKSGFVVKGVNLLEGYTSETTVLEAERLLHSNVLKGLSENKFTLEDVFDIIPLIVTNIENIQNLVPSKLDLKLKYLNDYDKFTYFVTTIAMPIDGYRTTLKSFIEGNENIVPISLLMYAGRVQLAMLTNPKYINAALRYIQSKFKLKLPLLPNTTICTGVGGAGKSEVLGRIATKNQGENAWVSGPTQSLIDGIVNPNKLSKAKGVGIWELVSRIIGTDTANKLKADIDAAKETSDFYDVIDAVDGDHSTVLKGTVTILKVLNPPEVIIIDEATHIPNVALLIISKFAELNNIHLLLLGDNAQAGLNNGIIHNISREHVFAWRTPKLYLSLRDSNVLKYYNQLGILLIFESLLDATGDVAIDSAVKQVFDDFLPKFSFRYHIDNENLSGELVTKDISPEIIEILKNNKDSQGKLKKVAFIGKADSPKYKLLTDAGVELTEALDISLIQGREFDYVVADLDWDTDIRESVPKLASYLRDLYTVITRSKKGTVLIDNHLTNNFKSTLDTFTGPSIDIRDALEDFRKRALEDLNDIQESALESEQKPTLEPTLEPEQEPLNIPLDEESELTLVPPEALTAFYESEDEVDTFEQNETYPIRVYTNIHVLNTGTRKEKDLTVWIGNGNNKDISIFLKNGEEASTSKELDALVAKLLLLKCLLAYGKKYYDRADDQIKELFDEDAFDNAETYITTEDATEDNNVDKPNDNRLIGLTNLKNEKRTVRGKLITLVAKLKGKDGNTYTVTLGGVANPDTWSFYADMLALSDRATAEEKAWSQKLKTTIIPDYINKLDNLIKEGKEVPVNLNKSLITELISKDGDDDPNPELRLLDIDVNSKGEQSNRTPYDNKVRYAVRSKVYTPILELPWLNKHLVGRPIMFVSSNMLLRPDELKQLYINQKTDGINRGVRMIPLSNKGISFKSLYRLKWRGIYDIPGSSNTMPFELFPQSIRMYISMWNFRANLLKFVNVLGEWKNGANSEGRVLTDDEVMDLIRSDLNEYNRVRGSEQYIDEKTYRQNASDEAKAKLKILWDFNDSLAGSVREFRLGYDINNGVRIRTLTNISADNPFYAEKLKKLENKSIQGIYIMPTLAEDYLNTLNALFNNVINKIVPTDRDPLIWIDKEESLKGEELGWFKNKVQDKTSMSVSGIDKDGNPIESTIEFANESTMKMIPLAMVLMAKYIEARLFNPAAFDENYVDSEDSNKPRYHIQITLDGKKVSLDYRTIATTLGLQETSTEGSYRLGLGLKPYNEEESIGTVDRRLDNLMSLMFHGLVETKRDNYFDDPSDLRATDADFKYGFFSDPTAYKSSDDDFYLVATNEALFSTNLRPGFPIMTFSFGKSKVNDLTALKSDNKSEVKENTLILTLKLLAADLTSQLGINISNRMLNKINTELELVDYVNSLLNPKFAKDKNQTGVGTTKNKSIIYQYFIQSRASKITSLIDHVELSDGRLMLIPIDLGLEIDDSWTEEWSDTEDCCKILSSPDGKKYKVKFDKKTGDITVEALNKVEIKGEPDPVTNIIEPTFGNIEFSMWSYIEEYLNSIDSSFADDLRALIEDTFANADKTLIPSDDTIKDMIDTISLRLRDEFDFDDIKGWNEARERLITEVFSEITSEKRLREGCIN